MKNRTNSGKTILGSVLLILVIVLVIGAPLFSGYAPDEANSIERLQGFSLEHPFGTDRFGRDILSRTLYGGQMTLIASFTALGMALVIGVQLGVLTGLRSQSLGVRTGLCMALCIVGLISVALFFWCEPLGKLFINAEDYEVIPLMGELMRFLSPLYFMYVFGEVLSGGIRGTGETFKPMVLTLLGTCASRILWILFIVPQNHTIEMIIGSYPVSWALTSCLFIIYYQIFKAKHLVRGEPNQKNA